MSWNYRIVHYFDGTGYGLHEVYYKPDGSPATMTEQPASFTGESPEDIRGALLMAKVDATKRPVLEEPEEWPGL